MKFKLFLLISISSTIVYSQNVGINSTGAVPNSSAMLDIVSSNKGILIPRVSLTGTSDLTTVPGVVTSVLVYNTANVSDVEAGYYYWNGSAWQKIVDSSTSDWSTTGNAGTTPATNFIGTLDAQDWVIKTNNTERIRVVSGGRTEFSGTADATGSVNSGVVEIGNTLRIDGNEIITNTNTPLYLQNDNNGDVSMDGGTYFLDASTDRIGIGTAGPTDKLTINGWIGRTAHNNGGLVGSYNSVGDNASQTNPIYVIGSNYTPAATALNNMYGIGYSHTNASFLTDPGPNTWGMYVAADGDARIWLGASAAGHSYFNTGGNLGINTASPTNTLHVVGSGRISSLAGAGTRMVTASATGVLGVQAVPTGDITSVAAGTGMTGGGTAGALTLNAVGVNGLSTTANDIRLGGTLIQATTITHGVNTLIHNLNNSGDFHIQDAGINHLSVFDNGDAAFGGDVYWRDENTGGTILAQLIDDGNDGRFIIRENGATSVDLDANTQFIFNEQGLDRNTRIESDGNANMFFLDAGLNRVSIGTGLSAGTFNVLGTSYHSDDIYLRDGAVNGGDVLVRIFDSADDGIIDVYEDNAINHRIHGNGVSVFNEQGMANVDVRMESDTRTNMFWLDANENLVRFGTANAGSDSGNGTTVAGITVDYVADFDRGVGASGTAIGVGSVEYLLDGSSETMINNDFSPTTHINRDLGSSTTVRGWDDVFADNFVNISDRREKDSIQDLKYGLEEVLEMRPVSYILKTDPFQETKLGLIAQEALVLVPESVKVHDYKVLDESKPDEYTKVEMDRMGMTYNALIPVLIKSIQEQNQLIVDLQKQMKLMQMELDSK